MMMEDIIVNIETMLMIFVNINKRITNKRIKNPKIKEVIDN